MKRIIYTFVLFMALTVPTYAFSGAQLAGSVSPVLVYAALSIAIVALVLSVFTVFWILKVKKVQDVALMNYKEDVTLTINGLKGNISRDIKNVRRELTKTKPVNRPANRPEITDNQEADKKAGDLPKAASDNDAVPNKKPQKRRYYHKKRPGNKPEGGDRKQSE